MQIAVTQNMLGTIQLPMTHINRKSSRHPETNEAIGKLSLVEAERIVAILDDTAEKLNFLDRFYELHFFFRRFTIFLASY